MSDGHHIVEPKYYIGTFVALLFLTVITVLASKVDLGILNVPVALGIALVKMSLVVLYFMALKWDNGISKILFIGSGVCIVIFFLLTFSDFSFRGSISEEEGIIFGLETPVKVVESISGHGESH